MTDRLWLELGLIDAWVPLMAELGVSEVARGPSGFLAQYRRAKGNPNRVSDAWARKRAAFLERHLAQAKERGEAWFLPNGLPTRRHLALVAWAYSPVPAKLVDRLG
jgi:hypothetical protein